jgi:hypothetical protein
MVGSIVHDDYLLPPHIDRKNRGLPAEHQEGAARRWWGFTGWSRPAEHGTRGGFVSSKIWRSIGSGVPYLLGKPREEAGGSRTNHMTRDYRKGFLEGFEQA